MKRARGQSDLERLLSASIVIAAQEKYIVRLERQLDRANRELGKAYLLADLRRDIREARAATLARSS
jgi:hypothetical protein